MYGNSYVLLTVQVPLGPYKTIPGQCMHAYNYAHVYIYNSGDPVPSLQASICLLFQALYLSTSSLSILACPSACLIAWLPTAIGYNCSTPTGLSAMSAYIVSYIAYTPAELPAYIAWLYCRLILPAYIAYLQ